MTEKERWRGGTDRPLLGPFSRLLFRQQPTAWSCLVRARRECNVGLAPWQEVRCSHRLLVMLAVVRGGGAYRRAVIGLSVTSTAEWDFEGHDATGGRSDPPLPKPPLWREEVSAGRHVDCLAGHRGQVGDPRLLGPVGGEYRGSCTRVVSFAAKSSNNSHGGCTSYAPLSMRCLVGVGCPRPPPCHLATSRCSGVVACWR